MSERKVVTMMDIRVAQAISGTACDCSVQGALHGLPRGVEGQRHMAGKEQDGEACTLSPVLDTSVRQALENDSNLRSGVPKPDDTEE